jgi:pimeloyl-ACP methyl ester carboxylesterase
MRSGFKDTLKTDPRVIYSNLIAQRDWKGGERVGSIAVPCLVCTGEHELGPVRKEVDHLVSALRSGASRVEHEVLVGAGHMLPMEKSVEFAEVVARFLGELR